MLVSCFKMALKIFYDSTVGWGVMCGGVGVERCLSDEFGGLVGNKIKFWLYFKENQFWLKKIHENPLNLLGFWVSGWCNF